MIGHVATMIAAVALGSCVGYRPCPQAGLAAMQCAAARGDKAAQLLLGEAYEAGTGVIVDLRRAAQLYAAAATPTTGVTFVYSPGVGKARGQVIPVRSGMPTPGLREAKYRWGRMLVAGRGTRQDVKKGTRLIEESQHVERNE